LTKTNLTFLGLDGVRDPHPTHRGSSPIGKHFVFQSLKKTKEKKTYYFLKLFFICSPIFCFSSFFEGLSFIKKEIDFLFFLFSIFTISKKPSKKCFFLP
jgi:hypothetical protein